MITPIAYFILGITFTYLAFYYADETVWNPISIILLLVATTDFAVAISFLRRHILFKKGNNE